MIKLKNSSLLVTDNYINGEWQKKTERFEVTNPATGDVIASCSNADASDAEQAVKAAKSAFADWKNRPAKERSGILRKWFNLIMENQEDLARLMTLEQGKPLAESMGEIAYGAAYIEYYAEEAKRNFGDTIPAPSDDKRIVIIKQPIGVVSAITPWNFPNSMITRKAAPALAAGCTFIIKPASETPLSALALSVLAEQAGIPAGVFNIVAGTDSAAIGRVLTQHPDIAKFSFTGSTAVGKKLYAQCAEGVKKVSLELGGNAPFIVFDDADLNAAVQGALISKYRNAGQTCVCANRLFVQRSVHDQFADKLAKAVAKFNIGNGLEEGVNLGPLITKKALDDVNKLVVDSLAAGAELVTGGQIHSLGGNFYQPTILKNVSNDMPVAVNEIFGPVAPLIPFDDEADLIEMANDTDAGLASYFYSRDIGRIWRVAEQLDYGMVGVNEGIISNAEAPFVGVKTSGIGREGSKYGIEDYYNIKYILMGGLDS